ncbi:MAG: P-loop NTPase [Nitrososphaerota archaeon]|nr:P-loop NTPase [Nitrososphaerota archaeon]
MKSPLQSSAKGLEPKLAGNLKVMSVALLTGNRAVPVRGTRKQDLIAQLFSVTNWGDLLFNRRFSAGDRRRSHDLI